jgi:hypothetical protein
MAIDFVPVFKIKVTPEDVVAHYKSIGVSDYPKNVNGMPNMKLNRTACKFIFDQKEKQMMEEYTQLIEQRQKEKMAEACTFRIDTSRNEDCPICMEPMQGRSILNCSHVFCINCSIEHFRTKQNCPLCRAEVCGPAVKPEVVHLPEQTVATIVEDNLGYVYPERLNYDLYNFILTSAIMFRDSTKADAFHFTNDVFDEIRKFGVDVATDVKSWYED